MIDIRDYTSITSIRVLMNYYMECILMISIGPEDSSMNSSNEGECLGIVRYQVTIFIHIYYFLRNIMYEL